MGTVLAVIYAVDTVVAYKHYRDSGDWLAFEWETSPLAVDYDRVIIRPNLRHSSVFGAISKST